MIRSAENFIIAASRFILAACASTVLAACASTTQPIGDWARPSDLKLDSSSLALVTIAVKCGQLEGDKLREQNSEICAGLRTALANIGAEEVGSGVGNAKPPDFTVWYIDTSVSTSSGNWTSDLAFYFTGGIIPIVSTSTAEAELRVIDSRGVVLDRSQMRVEEIRSFGWLSLASLVTRGKRLDRKKDLESRFFRFVQNRVYSQVARLRIAKGEEI